MAHRRRGCGLWAPTIVKFQTFRATLWRPQRHRRRHTKEAPERRGPRPSTRLLSRLELSEADHRGARRARPCARLGVSVDAVSTKSRSRCLERLGVARLKIGSGDLTNAPLLLPVARTGRPLILSTGHPTPPPPRNSSPDLSERGGALGVLAFGYAASTVEPESALRSGRRGMPRARAPCCAIAWFLLHLHDRLSLRSVRRQPEGDGHDSDRLRASGRLFRPHRMARPVSWLRSRGGARVIEKARLTLRPSGARTRGCSPPSTGARRRWHRWFERPFGRGRLGDGIQRPVASRNSQYSRRPPQERGRTKARVDSVQGKGSRRRPRLQAPCDGLAGVRIRSTIWWLVTPTRDAVAISEPL